MNSTPSEADRRIRRIGRSMYAATVVLAVGSAIAYVLLWLSPGAIDQAIRREILPIGVPYVLTQPLAVLGFVVGAVPVVAAVWGLCNAAFLFRAYGEGSVLTEAAGRRLRRFGVALIALPVSAFFVGAFGSLALTMNNPPGQRHFVLSADLGSIVLVVAGAIVIAIGWGMVEAARIADENRAFV